MAGTQGGVDGPDPQSGARMSAVLVAGLFLVALLGQFTLDRIGVEQFRDLDPRFVAFPVLTAAVVLWRYQPDHRDYRHPWPEAAVGAVALIGYLMLTALWALPEARVYEALIDLIYLGLLVILAVVVSAPDPGRARRWTLLLMYGVAVTYAAVGLVAGHTDAQGRTAAFAGGPNVYARVVLLGVLAAIALTVLYRSRWFLLGIPFLASATLLPASRGAIVAGLLTVVLFGVLTWRRWTMRGVWVTALLIPATVAVTWLLVPDSAAAVARTRFIVQLFEQPQLSHRPDLLAGAWAAFLDDPLFGGGLDAFYVRYGDAVDVQYPHNLVLELVTTGGVVALVLFVLFLGALIQDARLSRPLTSDQIAMLLAAGFVGIASMISGGIYDTRFFWVFVVLAVNPPAVRVAHRPNLAEPRAVVAADVGVGDRT